MTSYSGRAQSPWSLCSVLAYNGGHILHCKRLFSLKGIVHPKRFVIFTVIVCCKFHITQNNFPFKAFC